MSLWTKEQIAILVKNPHVLKFTEKQDGLL